MIPLMIQMWFLTLLPFLPPTWESLILWSISGYLSIYSEARARVTHIRQKEGHKEYDIQDNKPEQFQQLNAGSRCLVLRFIKMSRLHNLLHSEIAHMRSNEGGPCTWTVNYLTSLIAAGHVFVGTPSPRLGLIIFWDEWHPWRDIFHISRVQRKLKYFSIMEWCEAKVIKWNTFRVQVDLSILEQPYKFNGLSSHCFSKKLQKYFLFSHPTARYV